MHCSEKVSERRGDEVPAPAFMKIEGRLARPLPSDATDGSTRKFWLVPPRIIVALVIAAMVALMIPGLLMELGRGF
jgi:hypothetical protein